MKKISALALVVTASLPLTGCGRAVSIDLKLVEPCDQKDQALNGVKSYVLSSEGGEGTSEPVAFNIDGGAQTLTIPLGTVIVTAKAFADDVSAEGAADATPQAIGRTMPLAITDSTADISGMLLMGKTGTFARTTSEDGECSAMTADAAQKGRHGHTATYVPVLNQVLVVGGAVWVDNGNGPEERFLNSAELWDPVTGAFTALPDITARAYHAATAMPDGRVLVSGGFGVIGGQVTTLITALLFNPETKDFKTIQLRQPRAHHTSTWMPGPKLIAIVGGCSGENAAAGCTPTAAGGTSTTLDPSVETFDPEQDVATDPVTNGLEQGRAFHQASVVGEGAAQVLVVSGGTNADGPLCDLEFFQLAGSALTRVESANATPFPVGKCPVRHSAVSLDATRILVTGGQVQAPGGAPSGPGTNEAFFIGLGDINGVDAANPIPLLIGRHGHVSAKMVDGTVLVIGGSIPEANPVVERIAAQSSGGPLTSSPVNGLQAARDHAALTPLPNNQLFYSGGHTTTQPFTSQASAEIFFGR